MCKQLLNEVSSIVLVVALDPKKSICCMQCFSDNYSPLYKGLVTFVSQKYLASQI